MLECLRKTSLLFDGFTCQQLLFFDLSKYHLYWSCPEAVGSLKEDGDGTGPEDFSASLCAMIRRIVELKYYISSPVWAIVF